MHKTSCIKEQGSNFDNEDDDVNLCNEDDDVEPIAVELDQGSTGMHI